MNLGINTGVTFAWALTTLFAFWPLILLAPIGWRRSPTIVGFLALWGFLALIGLIARSTGLPGIHVIPEPLNTVLFLVAGAVLLLLAILSRRRS